jgi:hypothetical protein
VSEREREGVRRARKVNLFSSTFLRFQSQARYQMSRDEQKLRVQKEIDAMADIELDDEEKLKE